MTTERPWLPTLDEWDLLDAERFTEHLFDHAFRRLDVIPLDRLELLFEEER